MATVRIANHTVYVDLYNWDKMWSVHGSFAIPFDNIAGASTEKPPSFWESLKLIGTASPLPYIMAGTFLYHGECVFFDYQREDALLVIDLKQGTSNYKHLFVHVDEPERPEAVAKDINAALSS